MAGVDAGRHLAEADHREIVDLLHRHAEGMDRKDWDLFRSVFTDEIDIDYDSHRPGQRFRTTADEWTAHVARRLGRLEATQHALSNHRVLPSTGADGSVDLDSARVTAYIRADHLEIGADGGRSLFTIVGRYVDRAVRTDDGWRLTAVCLESWWNTGDRPVLQLEP